MPLVIFIFGLCGAGKSEAAKELRNKGFEVLDEDPGFSAPADGSLSPEKYARLQQYLMSGRDCAVVEATLFYEPQRQQAMNYLRGIPNVEVKWIGFENDLASANHNCLHRKNKGDGAGHVSINNCWSRFPHTFPVGTEIRPVYRLPLG
jgi:hypothetical protein